MIRALWEETDVTSLVIRNLWEERIVTSLVIRNVMGKIGYYFISNKGHTEWSEERNNRPIGSNGCLFYQTRDIQSRVRSEVLQLDKSMDHVPGLFPCRLVCCIC